jgi:hypothetical protein
LALAAATFEALVPLGEGRRGTVAAVVMTNNVTDEQTQRASSHDASLASNICADARRSRHARATK